MNRLQLLSVAAMLGFAGWAAAQTPTPGTADPRPSTSRTEGTAADRTPPGHTPTRNADPGTVNPMPATRRSEGTAADRTPPGETQVRGVAAGEDSTDESSQVATAASGKNARRASKLIGMAVQSQAGDRLGELKDLLIDASTGRITHAVVSYGGTASATMRFSALPWSQARSMMRDGKLIVEPARLQAAPSFAEGEWETRR